MARHEFGIMQSAPLEGERYDNYEPEKYNCITVDDCYIEKIVADLDDIDFFWHTLDVPGKGIAYCGVTLVPPSSFSALVKVIENIPDLLELKKLCQKAQLENKWMIHFGL